ncbi:hypothetical protein MHU86_13682 [Fragilaria crotonensis]|nr:hypothetical protein MHU86_13682 [Fragilaria crotonensis]
MSPEKLNDDKASHEDGSVSHNSSASKSSSSTESGKFRSPDKKKQRPGIQTMGQNEELDFDEHSEDTNTEEADLNTAMASSDGHEDSSTNRSLEDITTDLESRYNTQNSLGGGSPL